MEPRRGFFFHLFTLLQLVFLNKLLILTAIWFHVVFSYLLNYKQIIAGTEIEQGNKMSRMSNSGEKQFWALNELRFV